jgi:hypothetical protein
MELGPTTPALPKNIHMSYEYELIVCQSDLEAIENLLKSSGVHFLSISRGVGSRTPSTRLAGCWEVNFFDFFIL